MTAFTPAALVAELNADPKSLGLPADVSNVNGPQIASIRDKLNLKSGAGSEPVPSLPVQSSDFIAKIKMTETDGLTALQFNQLSLKATAPLVNIGDADTQTWLAAVLENCPNSLAAMQAAGTTTGSRSEVLWGTGFAVNDDQVLAACNTILG